MLPLYPAQQLLRGIAASITATLPDSDGEPKAGLTVLVTITAADGTAIVTDGSATDNTNGTYSYALPAEQLADLNWLTADWKVSTVSRATTTHEIVGGIYASLAAINTQDSNIAQIGADPETIRRARGTVEATFERICNVAFVPRFRRVTLDGSNLREQLLPDPLVRRLRSLTFRSTSTSSYSLTSDELAALTVQSDGILRYLNSQGVFSGVHTSGIFPSGLGNVVVEYEHGYDQPPNEIRDAAIAYIRERLQRPRSGIPDRAVSFAVAEGGTYRLAVPDGWSTGNPDIDAILERHAWPTIGIA